MKHDSNIDIGFPKEFIGKAGSLCGTKCFEFGEGENYRISHGNANYYGHQSIRLFWIGDILDLKMELRIFEGTDEYKKIAKYRAIAPEFPEKALRLTIWYCEKLVFKYATPTQLIYAIDQLGKRKFVEGRNSLRAELSEIYKHE